MVDLKYTLGTDPDFRSQCIEDEADWVAEEGFLLYPVHTEPVRAKPGCWLYFIRDGQMVSRARVQGFITTEVTDPLFTFAGEPDSKVCWNIKATTMQIAKVPVESKGGFQSFWCLPEVERLAFAAAFPKR